MTDIDECAVGIANNCSDLATCNNTDGSYSCICYKGYHGDGINCAGESLSKWSYSSTYFFI